MPGDNTTPRGNGIIPEAEPIRIERAASRMPLRGIQAVSWVKEPARRRLLPLFDFPKKQYKIGRS
jgi:hypothetical protein